MTTFLLICALLLALAGIAGAILPILPGPLLGLIGIWLLQLTNTVEISSSFLRWMTILTGVTMLADYYLPILGTKKYGGTKQGVRGSTIGLVIGIFFFPPRGMILFPLIGAYIGEYSVKKNKQHARKAARGSFLGSVGSTVLKLIVSGILFRKILMLCIQQRS